MFKKLLLGLVAHASLTFAAPFPAENVPPKGVKTTKLQALYGDPENCPGYAATNVVKTDFSLSADLTLAGTACNVYSEDIPDLKLEVEYQSDKRLHIKIFDTARTAFQVQEQVLPRPPNNKVAASEAALQFDIVEQPFSFKVTRKANNEVIFDSSAGKLVFEKQYVRWRTRLPQDPNIYGFGEHSDRFRFAKTYRRVLWNSESPNIPTNSNLYGHHPVYFDHRGDKGTHGVFLLNSDGMEIFMDQDPRGLQYLEYNTNGGIIDLYIMDGPRPADVSRQYAEVVGLPAMYPYWSLGFHQCKFGYWDVNMVAEVAANYSTAGIPLEVMWTDIDYMDGREDFTTDPERFPISKVRELVSTLHSRDQRYVLILDPGIHAVGNYGPYERGVQADVFLKGADGTDILGVQWPGASVWPDWLHPNTAQWWSNEIALAFNKDTGIDLDGLWVDMNEASNFCADETCNPRYKEQSENLPPKPEHAPRPNTGRPIPGFPASFQPSSLKPALNSRGTMSERDTAPVTGQMKGYPDRDYFYPHYRINNHRGDLTDFTIYTNTSNFDGTRQYDTHNFYGHMMAHTTYDAMLARRPGLRPFVLTRSTFAGSGRKVSHWFGDNYSYWEHYRTSIRQMLEFVAIHQMPLVGSDVCGFNGNTNPELCARWAMLGAFQPFYRNHAELSTINQEFYQWPLVAAAGKKAIDTRYKLLDYIYTAMHDQHKDGTPMINPLFFMYPGDENTFGIQDQWFYGDALLISPVTVEQAKEVTYYLPNDIFYDFWTHSQVIGEGKNVTQTGVEFTDIPIHIRGGTIVPTRVNSAMTTKALRKEGINLLVAPGRDGTAKGKLYLDEGELIDQPNASEVQFEFKNGQLSVTGSFGYQAASGESISVSKITVLGQDTPANKGTHNKAKRSITVDGPWQLNGAWSLHL